MKSLKSFVSKKPYEALLIVSGSVLVLSIVTSVALSAYTLHLISNVSDMLESVASSTVSTTDTLERRINDTRNELANSLENQGKDIAQVTDRLRDYRRQVGDVSETVETLQKISKIDPELLAKYSRVFFLNENYAPARLVEIPKAYRYSDSKILKIHEQVWPFLELMIDDAKSDKVLMYASSAYRSFNEQQALKGQYTTVYGAGTANQFSADQGYSEHQLGTTIDFTAPGLGGALDGFDKTPAYTWLLEHAYTYGFILSYPHNNTFYVYEPWHWRFVGIRLATELHTQKKNFYDLDQREIDEYLANLFDE